MAELPPDELNDTIILSMTPVEMLRKGLEMFGSLTTNNQTSDDVNIRSFVASYGLHPNQCAAIWNELLTTDIVAARVQPDQVDWRGFFLALNHARVYLTDEQRSIIFGNMDYHWMSATTWWWVCRIAALRCKILAWPTEWDDKTFLGSIGLTTDSTFWSPKEPTVLFCLDLWKPRCLSLHVFDDRRGIFQHLSDSGILDHVPEGKIVLLDYPSKSLSRISQKLTGTSAVDDDELATFKESVFSRNREYASMLNAFEVMKKPFRDGADKFPSYVYMVGVLVQYAIADPDPECADILEPLFS